MSEIDKAGFETKLIHSGEPRPLHERAVIQPIYQSSTFETIPVKDYKEHRYIRLNNTPNHISLGEKLAAIEGGEAGLVTSSGMSAISTALLALIQKGEHVLSQGELYGGTQHFFKDNFPGFGREVSFYPQDRLDLMEKMLQPNTRGIYVESVSNPTLRIPDHQAIVAFAKKHKLISFIDNTFPSPATFNPIQLGYDVVLHSATKYINGHTDIVAGVVVSKKNYINQTLDLLNYLGGSMDPHTCFLLNRGLKTLGVRMKYQCESSLRFAEALEKSGKFQKVIYPGLKSHPEHARAKELFRAFGGMVCFESKGSVSELQTSIKKLKLPVYAPSLGGVETLITRPADTSHSGVPKEEREHLGIRDTLVRVSVGLESTEDLIQDFLNAF